MTATSEEHWNLFVQALPYTWCSPKRGRCGPDRIESGSSSEAKGTSACAGVRRRHWGSLLCSIVSRMVVRGHERVTQLEQVWGQLRGWMGQRKSAASLLLAGVGLPRRQFSLIRRGGFVKAERPPEVLLQASVSSLVHQNNHKRSG